MGGSARPRPLPRLLFRAMPPPAATRDVRRVYQQLSVGVRMGLRRLPWNLSLVSYLRQDARSPLPGTLVFNPRPAAAACPCACGDYAAQAQASPLQAPRPVVVVRIVVQEGPDLPDVVDARGRAVWEVPSLPSAIDSPRASEAAGGMHLVQMDPGPGAAGLLLCRHPAYPCPIPFAPLRYVQVADPRVWPVAIGMQVSHEAAITRFPVSPNLHVYSFAAQRGVDGTPYCADLGRACIQRAVAPGPERKGALKSRRGIVVRGPV